MFVGRQGPLKYDMLSYWLGDDLIMDHKLNKDLQKRDKSNSGIYEQEDEG